MTTMTRALVAVVLAVAPAVHDAGAAAPVPSATAASAAPLRSLHPDFALLDAQGANVLVSGKPLSTMRSCGQCHDTAYIERHAFHADLGLRTFAPPSAAWNASPGPFGQWDPLRYRYLSQAGDERLDLSTAGWLMAFGERVAGGGPASRSRGGRPLSALTPDAGDPEASVLSASGQRIAWNWAESGTMELNCFLCHLERPNLAARTAAIRAGRFGDANTATLAGLGVVDAAAGGWTWNRAAFTADGLLDSRRLSIQDPTNANCAACHGQVHPAGAGPLQLSSCDLDQPQTATTGQVIAAQRIHASGANLAGKAQQRRAWDVHAERQLQCTDCHYALNNPAHANDARRAQLAHLRYDPRTLDIADYLQRPNHDIARGQSAQLRLAPEGKGTMRRCENCHDAAVSHAGWLPSAETHMARLACESCHIARMPAAAIESYDWTVLRTDGRPAQSCRGVDGDPADLRSLVRGFEPVLMQRRQTDGRALLAPYNLITSFYWVYEDAKGRKRPVRLADLRAAYFDGPRHAPEIVAAFDSSGDGVLGPDELKIDTPAKAEVVKARLGRLGLTKVHIEGQVQPYSINHGVARGEFALNDCKACHQSGSRIDQGLRLAAFAPVTPALEGGHNVLATGEVVRRADGSLHYQPVHARDALYVFGASRPGWVDLIGALAVAGTLAGVIVHALLRVLAARRRPPHPTPTHPVRMYDAYRRFWHWLQATSVVTLLLTGIVIHRPEWFGVLPFDGVVTLHNVVAVILVANAALSLFYHVATERVREYIPRPYGFIDDSIRQARYYAWGIFKGEPHPFEKRPDARMNPLQKATYFAILNVLLPMQIVTGALIWGVQRWPEVAGALGGLPLLGPLHALTAWMFGCFVVIHVYLATAGATPLAAIRGMVTGTEEVEDHPALAGR